MDNLVYLVLGLLIGLIIKKSDRWAIIGGGQMPVELTNGELFEWLRLCVQFNNVRGGARRV